MSHQKELEKKLYRNWVRGGLAYKYLKQGIEGFAHDVVQQEHTRILSAINYTQGLACNQCNLGQLQPIHQCKKDYTGRKRCPWGQSNCNCVYPRKQACPQKLCDSIMEEIVKSHGSTPPTPNWKNTDIHKWCSEPWEIAKCYINAAGYSDKSTATDIDISGLLHVFINNTKLHSHFSCNMAGPNIFMQIRERRNDLFHSPAMEMKETVLSECIDDIIALLEDPLELNQRQDAQQAVIKLKQLKQQGFIITTYNETEVCREALSCVAKRSEELQQMITIAKNDINAKRLDALAEIQTGAQCAKDAIEVKTTDATAAIQTCLQNAKDDIDMKQSNAVAAIQTGLQGAREGIDAERSSAMAAIQSSLQDALKELTSTTDIQSTEQIIKRVNNLEVDNSAFRQELLTVKQRLLDIENYIDALKVLKATSDKHGKRLKYIEDKKALQNGLVNLYQQHYVRTSLSPLKTRENDVNIQEVFVPPRMKVKEEKSSSGREDRKDQALKSRRRNIHGYKEIFQTKERRNKTIYIVGDVGTGKSSFGKMMIQDWCTAVSDSSLKRADDKNEHNLEVGATETNIYVRQRGNSETMVTEQSSSHTLKDVNSKESVARVTNKSASESDDESSDDQSGSESDENSSSCDNYSTDRHDTSDEESESESDDNSSSCDNLSTDRHDTSSGDQSGSESDYSFTSDISGVSSIQIEYSESESDELVSDKTVNEMSNFEFLFFVPLQRMNGLVDNHSDITDMIKAIISEADLASNDLIDRILEEESEQCLIVADGLDELVPLRNKGILQHVSYGLLKSDKRKHATVVTFSRPSAKGILNMKTSEYDQKVEILGIGRSSIQSFVTKYLSMFSDKRLSFKEFKKKIKNAKIVNLEKTPLLLQQLLWLYGTGNEVGHSLTDTYSHIVNIMLGWSQNKEEIDNMEEDLVEVTNEVKDTRLPKMLDRFPRCQANKGYILPIAKVAFGALISEVVPRVFGRLYLRGVGISKNAIQSLIKHGILNEENCFDPTEENTKLAFIHTSYLEFFAALHVSSQCIDDKQSESILKDLFDRCKSVADILHLSNVLKMICGLSPFLTSELLNFISETLSNDECFKLLRHRRIQDRVYEEIDEIQQIQDLQFKCLSESDSDVQPMMSLCDVTIDDDTEMPFLEKIASETVVSLHVDDVSVNEVWRWITSLKHLQYIFVEDCDLFHSDMELFSSFIQETPLRRLTMTDVDCKTSDCGGHRIDLSRQEQLQILQLTSCKRVLISNINTNNLEMVHLNSYNALDVSLLLNADKLTELYLGPNYSYTKQVNSVVHTLQQLRRLRLYRVDIADRAITVAPEMRNLEHIRLKYAIMNVETFCTLVDSLTTVEQSVQVDTMDCVSRDETGRDYVRQNERFEVMQDNKHNFNFRTNK